MIGERQAHSWQRRRILRSRFDTASGSGRSDRLFSANEPVPGSITCFRYCAVADSDFSDVGPQRAHLDTSRVFGSPYADPILLVDPNVALGRGLRHQLTRFGFCADLAITLEAARACIEHKYYHAVVVVTDPSTSRALFELRQLRESAPQTWIIVLAIRTADPAREPMFDVGADACLLLPLRFSDLLFRLGSFGRRARAG